MKILVLISALLVGCASSSKTFAPDGSTAYSLNCSGTARNWGMCYEKAGELCKEKGYEVLGGGTDSSATLAATNGTVVAGSSNTRNLLIKCK